MSKIRRLLRMSVLCGLCVGIGMTGCAAIETPLVPYEAEDTDYSEDRTAQEEQTQEPEAQESATQEAQTQEENLILVMPEENPEAQTQEQPVQEETQQTEHVIAQEDVASVALTQSASTYYAYRQLNQEQQQIYQEILYALTNRQAEVEVSTLEAQQLQHAFNCVMYDHPELFYISGYRYTIYTVNNVPDRMTFYGSYTMTEQEIQTATMQIEKAVTACLAHLPQSSDEYEKVKYLYDYVIMNTEYDRNASNNQNICSVFINGRSVCQGYAKAFQYLLQRAGIEAVLVTGYTQSQDHAWNLIRVNGAYYYADPTWGDASYRLSDTQSGVIDRETVNYDYFLITSQELYRTHKPDGQIAYPDCTAVNDNYYVREGCYLTGYSEDAVKSILERAYARQTGYVTIKCASSAVYQEVYNRLIQEQTIFRLLSTSGGSVAYTRNEQQLTISFWLDR